MEIPKADNSNWKKIIEEDVNYNLEFLATKILLSRLRLEYRKNPNAKLLQDSISELRNFFEKNIRFPKVQNDLNKMMKGGL